MEKGVTSPQLGPHAGVKSGAVGYQAPGPLPGV